jgi:hypothetical protein
MPGREGDEGGERLAGLAAGGLEALGDERGGNLWRQGAEADLLGLAEQRPGALGEDRTQQRLLGTAEQVADPVALMPDARPSTASALATAPIAWNSSRTTRTRAPTRSAAS